VALLGLQASSLIDFPGKLAAVVFLPGCQFRCPYCHNPEFIVRDRPGLEGGLEPKDIIAFFKLRRRMLDGVVFSGGEPLLSPELPELVNAAKRGGLSVKIDTNGSDPGRLVSLRPDFVSLDIKTSPEKYRDSSYFFGEEGWHSARRTLEALRANRIPFEIRTTLVPGIVTREDVAAIAGILHPDETYAMNRFRPGKTLDPSFSSLEPYPENELEEMLRLAKAVIPDSKLR
jgi:pyruvate formate lyase activating enzyme